MFVYLLMLFVVFILLFVLFVFRESPPSRGGSLGVEGELLYADQGRDSKAFISKKYGVGAKPDFLVRLKSGKVALVEYKSRDNGNIYQSDIVQAKVSALAARDTYPVEVVFIKTKRRLQEIPLPKSNDALYKEVELYVMYARLANKGKMLYEYTDNLNQCGTCSMRTHCQR